MKVALIETKCGRTPDTAIPAHIVSLNTVYFNFKPFLRASEATLFNKAYWQVAYILIWFKQFRSSNSIKSYMFKMRNKICSGHLMNH